LQDAVCVEVCCFAKEKETDSPLPLPIFRQYEQLKLRYESLELRGQQAQQALAAAQADAAEAGALQDQLARLQAEHAALRASAEAASGSREGEAAALRATSAALRDELADLRAVNDVLRQQLARAALAGAPSLASAGDGGALERSPSVASAASLQLQLGGRQRTASEALSDVPLTPDAGESSCVCVLVCLAGASKERSSNSQAVPSR
jgi:hypothetical protein